MTLKNCQILLKHYESIVSGETAKPVGHVNWDLVVKNAKVSAEEMKEKVKHKSSPEFRKKHDLEQLKKETPSKPDEAVQGSAKPDGGQSKNKPTEKKDGKG